MYDIHTFTGGMAQTNAWLMESPQGNLLIDAPEGTARWLLARGVRVDTLLITHQHFDHVQDAAEVKAEHGCQALAWSPFSRELTLERLVGAVDGRELVPEFSVDAVLAESDQIVAGGCSWRLLHIPGHSPDSVCFHQPEGGFVFGGDVLFLDGVGRTDFPGGSFEQLMEGIRGKLMVLPDETRLHPGHGPATTLGRERRHNPFLTNL
jgi:glyoxylase-like metal-dependent hydrolase (beta-lactamase superfamily II)